MRKIILVLFVGVLGVFVVSRTMKTSVVVNDVVLENVEALAGMEEGGIRVKCVMIGENKCPTSGVKVEYVIEGLSLDGDEEVY